MRPLVARLFAFAFVLFALSLATRAGAELVPLAPIPAAAAAHPLDPDAATRAYLDTLPADARARSDAYFEGGYWLLLVDVLVSVGVGLLLLHTGISARMRDLGRRVTKVRFVHVAVYSLLYLIVTAVLGFPLGLYKDFVREHSYGLSTMTFGAWMGDQAKGFVIGAVVTVLLVPALYAVFAVAKRTWWLWAAAVLTTFLVFAVAVAPVYVSPVFNHYRPVASEEVRGPILSMARANGVGASEVWEFDASRQSNRVSANVSGMLGTQRISLNDNLLKRCSLPEIQAVMGHEMGHYVLNHIGKMILELGLLILVGLAFVRFGFDALRARFAGRWRVEGIDDPAGWPLLMLLFTTYFFLVTPVFHTIIRTSEAEADMFGLNASRQPDGMAQVALKLATYRKLDPGPIEELVFFDHPSGRARIHAAMQWKAEHLGDPVPPTAPAAPTPTP